MIRRTLALGRESYRHRVELPRRTSRHPPDNVLGRDIINRRREQNRPTARERPHVKPPPDPPIQSHTESRVRDLESRYGEGGESRSESRSSEANWSKDESAEHANMIQAGVMAKMMGSTVIAGLLINLIGR